MSGPPERHTDDEDTLTLEGARGLRALAHPARASALERLMGGTPATATRLASDAGISASAMSYHLRELAKAGLVRRVEGTTDKRERLWEATAGRISVVPEAGGRLPTLTVEKVLGRQLDTLATDIAQAVRESGTDSAVTVSHHSLWLTDDERYRLARAVSDAVEAMGIGERRRDLRPAQARPYEAWGFLVPGRPEGAAGTGDTP